MAEVSKRCEETLGTDLIVHQDSSDVLDYATKLVRILAAI